MTNRLQQSPTADELHRRSRLVIQTLLILLIPLVIALSGPLLIGLVTPTPLFQGSVDRPPPMPVPFIVMGIFVSAMIILVRLGRPTISALVLIGVWTLLTTGSLVRFGVNSNFPALLIVPICLAGLLLDRVACLSLAGLGSVLVGFIAWYEQVQMPPLTLVTPDSLAELPILSAVYWIALFWAAALLTSLLAGNLQRALQQSRAQAEELRALSEQLEARVAEQTEQIIATERESATLAERTRLSREIHDTLAQGFTSIVVQLGAARRALDAEPIAANEHIALAERMARESLAEARRSVWNLRAPALERGDLGDALRGLSERQAGIGATSTFQQHGSPWPLPPDLEGAFLRVAQEALSNVEKHAQATHVAMHLHYLPNSVRLTIHDNGLGFDQEALAISIPSGPWSSFGLAGMRERLAALGGTLELRNDNGAVVEATAPHMRQMNMSTELT
jgi:signal transduction histidine kinase